MARIPVTLYVDDETATRLRRMAATDRRSMSDLGAILLASKLREVEGRERDERARHGPSGGPPPRTQLERNAAREEAVRGSDPAEPGPGSTQGAGGAPAGQPSELKYEPHE